MSEYQAQMYEKYIQSLNHITNIPITERRLGIQISNVVFPSIDILLGDDIITSDNFSKNYGGDGLRQLFQNKKNNYGIYIYGSVGTGKTFLLNLFYKVILI